MIYKHLCSKGMLERQEIDIAVAALSLTYPRIQASEFTEISLITIVVIHYLHTLSGSIVVLLLYI